MAYQHLEANTKQGNNQDWVGILHKAVHTFTGEKAGDLNFNVGDTVTVFQILENGWWLGSKDDVVGWFPGSYVEVSSCIFYMGSVKPKTAFEHAQNAQIQIILHMQSYLGLHSPLIHSIESKDSVSICLNSEYA